MTAHEKRNQMRRSAGNEHLALRAFVADKQDNRGGVLRPSSCENQIASFVTDGDTEEYLQNLFAEFLPGSLILGSVPSRGSARHFAEPAYGLRDRLAHVSREFDRPGYGYRVVTFSRATELIDFPRSGIMDKDILNTSLGSPSRKLTRRFEHPLPAARAAEAARLQIHPLPDQPRKFGVSRRGCPPSLPSDIAVFIPQESAQ